MYTPTQLEVIKRFGRKELTEGCYVIVDSVGQKYSDNPQKGRMAKYITDGKYLSRTQILTCNDRNRRFKSSWELREIIGHIPHLEDLFRVAEEKLGDDYEIRISNKSIYFFSRSKGAFEYPYKRGTTLLEQPESVLIDLLEIFAN